MQPVSTPSIHWSRRWSRRRVVLLCALAMFGLLAWFFAINVRPGVLVSFKGLERVYTEHEFLDVALFSFTNNGKVDVTLFDWKTSPNKTWVGPSRLYFFVHDADSTNALVYRGVRELALKPGHGEVIAVPAAHGMTNWQAQLEFNYEGLRNRLALWLGPTRAASSFLRCCAGSKPSVTRVSPCPFCRMKISFANPLRAP